MELFCTKCRKIASCKITSMSKDAPVVIQNQGFIYDKTTKCDICHTDSVHYKPV